MLGTSGSPSGSVLLALIALVLIGVSLYAVIDAAKRPNSAWQAAGKSKALWIVLIVVFVVVEPIGLIIAVVYLSVIRRVIAPG